MSTISLPFEKQIRNFFIADAVSNAATVKAFMTDATAGQVGIYDIKGGAVVANQPFYFVFKDPTGKFVKSDIVDPKKIHYLNQTAPQDKVGRKEEFTITSIEEGKTYNLGLKLHYANSEVTFSTIYAAVVAKTADTTTTVAQKLGKMLADNLGADMKTSNPQTAPLNTIYAGVTAQSNKYFTITVEGNKITIQEKDWILSSYVPGLKTFDQLMWNSEINTNFLEASDEVTKVVTPGVYAKGAGYQVLEMERYLVGHRAEFMGPDATLTFNRPYQADVTKTYTILDLSYFDVPMYDPQRSDKIITLATAIPATATTIKDKINAAMGSPIADVNDDE